VTKPRAPFTNLTGDQYANTLVQKLTPVADRIRDLRTRLGGVPYQVSLVRTRWSGGRRNHGTEEVVSVTPILPTPKVQALDSMNQVLQSAGLDEVGTIRVTDISPAYTEDQLVGVGPQGEPIPSDENFYWEITFPRPLPQMAVQRRYTVSGVPNYNPTRFGWSVALMKAGEERDRVTGTPGSD
jgi:hypothetical protein